MSPRRPPPHLPPSLSPKQQVQRNNEDSPFSQRSLTSSSRPIRSILKTSTPIDCFFTLLLVPQLILSHQVKYYSTKKLQSSSQISSMASISPILSLHLVFSILLFTYPVLSNHSPTQPPLPPADEISPPPATPSSALSPAPSFSSPLAPPPSDLASKSPSPAPTPDDKSPSLPPAPTADTGDIKRESQPNAIDLESKGESSGGMSSG